MRRQLRKLAILVCIAAISFFVVAHFVITPPVRAHMHIPGAACINNLRQIDCVKKEWAQENPNLTNHTLLWSDVQPYLGRGINGTLPVCPLGGTYSLGKLDEPPKCSYPGHVLE